MQNAFESWIGQQVVVQLAFGQIKVSLRGKLLRDKTETLLMKPEAGSEVEIPKIRVLAIEEVDASTIASYGVPFEGLSRMRPSALQTKI